MGKVVVEEEKDTPLAVVYHGGELGEELAKRLREAGLRVVSLSGATAALPVWEKPDYVFFFASGKEKDGALLPQWEEGQGKKTLILENFEGGRFAGANLTVKIRGRVEREAARKIMTFAFSPAGKRELLIVGPGASQATISLVSTGSTGKLEELLHWRRKKTVSRQLVLALISVAAVLILLSPLLALGGVTITGFWQVARAVAAFRRGDVVGAQTAAGVATAELSLAKGAIQVLSVPFPVFGGRNFTERYFSFLSLGGEAADLVSRTAILAPKARSLVGKLLSPTNTENLAGQAAQLRLELKPIDQDLGLLEGQWGQLLTPRVSNLLSWFGVSKRALVFYKDELAKARMVIGQIDDLLAVFDELVPGQKGATRTYLVVLQNSAELRPTGGFIGSYALVRFDSGHLASYKFYDVYAADGQMHGAISPPDEILHYLGQPSWFMRDANWAPDFPLTAKRLEWFLEKETGMTVNGVAAINLGAVQLLLKATGPVTLSSGETISAENFFDKAEYASEINFFPGSEQKPQFMAQVAEKLLGAVTSGQGSNWPGLGQAVAKTAEQKEILVYLNSPLAEEVMVKNSWAGSVATAGCALKNTNCLMLVEANLGANKANYFVRRGVRVDTVVDKAGGVETTVLVRLRNESPSVTWPGGVYKDYLRFLVPLGSKFEGLDLGDKRTATLSSVLTADIIKAVPAGQFLVFQSEEQGIVGKELVPVAASFGTLLELPIQTERQITFKYRPPYKLDFGKTWQDFDFVFLKQPGAGADLLDFSIDYPSFLTPVLDSPGQDFSVLALPQKLIYNTDLTADRKIKIKFKR